MTEPAAETAPQPPPAEPAPPAESPAPTEQRRVSAQLLTAIIAVVLVIVMIVGAPLWAPPVMRLLPWGAPAAKPSATTSDPSLSAARVEASRNAAAIELLNQRLAALEARPQAAPPDLSPIRQQLTALNETTADLGQKIAALDKAERQQPAIDPKTTALALVLLQINDAAAVGRPFEAEYQALLVLSRDHPEIAKAAEPLAGPAQSGVATRAVLAARLRELAPQIATARSPPKPSWKSQIVARLRSLVTIRRVDGAEQSPAEAAVSTAEHAMATGDLAGAVDALAGLSGPNQAAAQPWLQTAKAQLAVEEALRQLQGALTTALGSAAPGQGG